LQSRSFALVNGNGLRNSHGEQDRERVTSTPRVRIMKIFFRSCIIAVAVFSLPPSSYARGVSLSHTLGMHRAHHENRDLGQFPFLYGPVWNDGEAGAGVSNAPAPFDYPPPAYGTYGMSMFRHWVNTSAFLQEPYLAAQPDAKIIENTLPLDVDRDRMWVERCQPRILFDDESVPRYHYAEGVKGCAAGQWRD
jgi:hypothetical protein